MNYMLHRQGDAREADVLTAILHRQFSGNAIEAARAYARMNRVQRLEVSADGRRVNAETRGSRPRPYTQMVVLSCRDGEMPTIQGACTCPQRINCKHVAAVLMTASQQHQLPLLQTIRAEAPQIADPALPAPLSLWLDGMGAAEEAESEAYPPQLRQRLLYLLESMPRPIGAPTLRIRPMSVSVLKSGEYGRNAQEFAPSRAQGPQMPAFLRPSDRLILRRLAFAPNYGSDPEAVDTLQRIIATGRAYWGSLQGPVVTAAPPRPASLGWSLQDDGSQSPVITLAEPAVALRVPPPWFVEPESGLMGPLQLDLPEAVVGRLLDAPAVPAEHVELVRSELTRRVPNLTLPVPTALDEPEVVQAPLRPHLRLLVGRPRLPGSGATYYGYQAEPPPIPLARIAFGYGPFVLPPDDRRRLLVRERRLYRVVRDRAAEAAAMQQLGELGFDRVGRVTPTWQRHPWVNDLMLMEEDSDAAWLVMMLQEVPRLRDEGWTVEIDDDFPFRIAIADGEWTAELAEGSGIDWLELHLGVMVDGTRIDLVPALVTMIETAERAGLAVGALLDGRDDGIPFLVPLDDGRMLSVALGRVRPILLTLLELFSGGMIEPCSGKVRFTRLDAANLAALEQAADVVWQGGEALRALGRMLREAGDTIPRANIPKSFLGSLRPYQAQGVDWLQFLRGAELGGILADDMGLGKTVQTLAHLLIERAEGRLSQPALVVCPTSLVPNWVMEAERFAPSLKLLALHGPNRKERFGEIAAHDLVVTTYPLLTRDHHVLTAQDWHIVVLDEAQTIKNPNAETTRQALRLKAGQRLCLSGTPLQNHLGELWSLFDFLAPGFLGSAQSFRTRFRTPIEKRGDTDRQMMLSRRVRPFLLRRTKEEVAIELPPKTEITEPVEMGDAQRAIYESIRLAMHARVRQAIAEKGLARSGIIILDALLKLRQACCDPRLLKLQTVKKAKAGSAKLERLMEMLTLALAEGRRVLLFSQFTEMLALIERALAEAKIDYVMLTGNTMDRATPVRRFQAGQVPLFLISLKAGGVGLNLTAADTVIHYDPWWNPAVEDQATDRAHRIGQDKKVFVHRLVTLGTIEEKMETLKDKKRALVASVLDAEHGGALKLTEADVEALFGVM